MAKATINIGHLSTAYHTNFVIMGNDDLKNEMNKEITWKLYGTGPSMVDAFRKGNLDIGYMGLPPAVIGIDQGVPIKCVAGGHVEGTIMISNMKYETVQQQNNKISEVLAQFKGKTIGTPSRGSIHDAIINYYLEKYNLQDDVEVRNYKQAEFIAWDMKKGVLEGGVGTPSLAIFAQTLLDSQLIIPSDYLLPNNPSYGIFFHENIIEKNPEIVRIFLKHHKKASRLLREDKTKSAEIICQTMDVLNNNTKYVRDVLKISPKYCIALSDGYLKSSDGFINTLYRLGYIKEKLNIKEICNFEFLNDIHPEDHHYTIN